MKNKILNIESTLILVATILLGCTVVEVFRVCATTQEVVFRMVN